MQTHADKNQENQNRSVANAVSQKKSDSKSTFQFEDNRPEAIQMRKLQEMANNHTEKNSLQFVNNRPEAIAQRKLEEMMNNSPQNQRLAQFQKMANKHTAEQEQPIQKNPRNTGIPDSLKSGIENLSGYSMDDVKVHYNSDKPAQLNAHAYAQGTDIHIASGQEKHLPHEAWHVVQQKQGRVKPSMQMKGKININDDKGLEKEADVMGNKALQVKLNENKSRAVANSVAQRKRQLQNSIFSQPIQKRKIHSKSHGDFITEELDRDEIVAIYKQLKRINGSKDTLEDLEEAMRKGEHKGTPIESNLLNLSDDLTAYGEEPKDREDLSKIAKPIVQSLSEEEFQLQDKIMKYFNQEIEKEGEGTMNLNVFRVCSVEVDQLADGKFTVSLKEPILKIPSGLANGFRFIKSNEELKQNINRHIIAILIKSGQMAYLEHNKMVNDRWRIIVDVDFYYNRPADAIGFHKDTVGRSLFVNLNFNNDSEIIGPEYVLNPDPIKEHDQHIADKLPQRFLDDLTNERHKLGSPTSIEATRVPSKGMVSFVDELVHHTTPYRDRRGVTGEQLRQYAEYKSGDKFKEARKAYLFTEFFRNTHPATGFPQERIDDMDLQPSELEHLRGVKKSEVVNTPIFAKMIKFLAENPKLTKIVKLTRSAGTYKKDELLAHGLSQEEVNELFAGFNKPDMETVSLASCTDQCDISTESHKFPLPKLRRQMSQDLLTHNVPAPSQAKRQFFRTWVTALPRDVN